MVQQANLISDVRNGLNEITKLVEQAQAKSAALVQMYNKLGGSSFLTGHDWSGSDITEQEFLDAVSSLGTAMPDLLGAHGTNLYKMRW